MPWNKPLHQQRAPFNLTVDEALRRAFDPILKEAVPVRFCIALDALRQKGLFDDTCKHAP